MEPFTTRPSPQLVGGPGSLAELPSCVRKSGGRNGLLVSEQGVAADGPPGRAAAAAGGASANQRGGAVAAALRQVIATVSYTHLTLTTMLLV